MSHDAWLESLRRAAGDPDVLGRVLAEDLPRTCSNTSATRSSPCSNRRVA